MTFNIIADIGGQFDPLMKLLARMPKVDKVICVGDLNDRGPNSKEVIHWAMSDLDVIALDSNHGHMLVDLWRYALEDDYGMEYSSGDFFNNGGGPTLASYGAVDGMNIFQAMRLVPSSHIMWLDSLPWKFEAEGLVVTHAPIPVGDAVPHRFTRIWNRSWPRLRKGEFQVFGHNAARHVRWWTESEPGVAVEHESETPVEGAYACCIDASRRRDRLTGMHWPSREIFQEVYENVVI